MAALCKHLLFPSPQPRSFLCLCLHPIDRPPFTPCPLHQQWIGIDFARFSISFAHSNQSTPLRQLYPNLISAACLLCGFLGGSGVKSDWISFFSIFYYSFLSKLSICNEIYFQDFTVGCNLSSPFWHVNQVKFDLIVLPRCGLIRWTKGVWNRCQSGKFFFDTFSHKFGKRMKVQLTLAFKTAWNSVSILVYAQLWFAVFKWASATSWVEEVPQRDVQHCIAK